MPWVGAFSREMMSATLDAVARFENLHLAFRKAALGKRGGAEVAGFEHRLEENLCSLADALLARAYRPGPYTSFYVHEPKRRLISAAPFRDRVVHHALMNVIEPPFERVFVADSYANRRGKGTHRALDRAQALARRHRYVLQLDVRRFFPSIDHAILRHQLRRKLSDDGLLWLIDGIMASGAGVLTNEYHMVYFRGDDLLAALRPRGLPIGNLTSQFWGNVHLSPIDHCVKRELGCPGYVRYVDDLLLFGDDKRVLWSWKIALEERFAQLRLTIHAGGHPRPVTEGIPFLGFVVYPARRRLKRRKGIQYRRRLRALVDDWRGGRIEACDAAASLRGWLNHAGHGSTAGLRRTLLAEIPASIVRLLD